MDEPLELSKLETIDRRVFFWLWHHASRATIKSWIEFTAKEYRRRGLPKINPETFCEQAYEAMSKKSPFNE